ncbi:MAG TPA: DUF1349 domain-containing protein [Coleofasciculaceae cyanobacterium]
MQWLNEPTEWKHSDNRLTVKTSPKTDFWRTTHYGFIRDSGHFYFNTFSTDFVMEVGIRGNYKDLYDQAGIMFRFDEKHWIKTGIEFVDGVQNLSAVVTHDYSDWSMTPLPNPPEVLHLRVERCREAIHLSYQDDNLEYRLFRLTYLLGDEIQAGIMCASPEGNGFEASFEGFP